MSLASAMNVNNCHLWGLKMFDLFITDWFTLMIAALGGWGLTLFLGRVSWPKPPLDRFIVALLGALYLSLMYGSLSKSVPLFFAVAGFAFAGVGLRSFVELCLRHWEISQAVEAINALPTLEERLKHLGTLPVGIQHKVLRRTLGPELLPMFKW